MSRYPVLPNLTYRFNAINENPDRYFVEYQPTDSELYVDRQRLRMVDTAGKEENKGGGLLVWSIS